MKRPDKCLLLLLSSALVFAACDSSKKRIEAEPTPAEEPETEVRRRSRPQTATSSQPTTPVEPRAQDEGPPLTPVAAAIETTETVTAESEAAIATPPESTVEYVENGIGIEDVPPAEAIDPELRAMHLPEPGELPLVVRYKGEVTGFLRLKLMEPGELRVRLLGDDKTPALGRNRVRITVDGETVDAVRMGGSDSAELQVMLPEGKEPPVTIVIDLDSERIGAFQGTVNLP